jgi:hypothetical protein
LQYNEAVHQPIISFKKDYDSVRMEVLYSILTEFVVPMKLVRLIKMGLNETCSKIRMGYSLRICLRQQTKWWGGGGGKKVPKHICSTRIHAIPPTYYQMKGICLRGSVIVLTKGDGPTTADFHLLHEVVKYI